MFVKSKAERMKINKKTITICSSGSHYKNAVDIEKSLKMLGFKVLIPNTAKVMKENNNFDINLYKTWFKDKKNYFKKTKYMEDHFKKVIKADAILVTNFEKNGIKGYIGGNVLMEMTIAFHYKKPIFIYNDIAEDLNIKEEVYGLNPVFIDRDLQIIAKRFQ